LQLPLPFDINLRGVTVFTQWFVVDANGPSGAASSRGAEIRFF
jgi:hypothetical protein